MFPPRLKLAVCGSAVLLVVLLGSLTLPSRGSVLDGLGWEARLAVAALLGAGVMANGFLEAILWLRSVRRAFGYALMGFFAGTLLFLLISGHVRLWHLMEVFSGLPVLLFLSAPFTFPFVTAFTLLWYHRLQPDADSTLVSWPEGKILLPSLVLPGLLIWSLATARAWTVEGIYEPAHYDLENFMMGAGNVLILIRGGLALLLAVLATFWGLMDGTLRARLLRLAIAPGVLILFFYSVSSLDRTSPGFSEAEFQRIYQDHEAGRMISLQEARRRLGDPLYVKKFETDTLYSYTFTPSGGYGYHKRALTFDARGILTQVTQGDEP